jgi:hypothetical protein
MRDELFMAMMKELDQMRVVEAWFTASFKDPDLLTPSAKKHLMLHRSNRIRRLTEMQLQCFDREGC